MALTTEEKGFGSNEGHAKTMDEFNDGGLRRGLKLRHVQLIALGGIIGSCYFLGAGYTISKVGPAAALAYILGGGIILMVMLCLGELAVAMPISGSFITYAADYISPAWACGVGWSYWLNWVAYVPSEMIASGIIMHHFFPMVSSLWWAVLFGLLLTIVNISHVSAFGEIEFWFAIIKIAAIVVFCILAVLIFFGVIGNGPEFLGTTYVLDNGGLFPAGKWAVLLTMVMILVNFQGSEIIGLGAGETKEPSKSIPIAVRNVTYRIVALYVIPLLLLVSIFPWDKAGVEECVFAAALNQYGLNWAGGLFSFVVLTAGLSCANSGLYGTVRSLYALSREGMAPRFLGKLNKHGVPANATYLTIACCWIFIVLYTFYQSGKFYTYLLALSGFTGELCWISLCWSQLNFRKRLLAAGYTKADLKFATPFYPYLTHVAIWSQVLCLVLVAWNPDLRSALYLGVPAVFVPILLYKILKIDRHSILAQQARIQFEDRFPVREAGIGV